MWWQKAKGGLQVGPAKPDPDEVVAQLSPGWEAKRRPDISPEEWKEQLERAVQTGILTREMALGIWAEASKE